MFKTSLSIALSIPIAYGLYVAYNMYQESEKQKKENEKRIEEKDKIIASKDGIIESLQIQADRQTMTSEDLFAQCGRLSAKSDHHGDVLFDLTSQLVLAQQHLSTKDLRIYNLDCEQLDLKCQMEQLAQRNQDLEINIAALEREREQRDLDFMKLEQQLLEQSQLSLNCAQTLCSEAPRSHPTNFVHDNNLHLPTLQEEFQEPQVLGELGSGSYARVVMVKWNASICAMKVLDKSRMTESEIGSVQDEREILSLVDHPFVCRLLFAHETPDRYCFGMDYYAGGDLCTRLNDCGSLSLEETRFYAAELVSAITYLHNLDILHRDLKPENIMIDRWGHVALVDFGIACQNITSACEGANRFIGTLTYMAPEAIIENENGELSYGKAYDWWSLGAIVYEMLYGERLFDADDDCAVLDNIAAGNIQLSADYDPAANAFIRALLNPDPNRRLGGAKASVKKHPFFIGVDWSRLDRRAINPIWIPELSCDTDTRYMMVSDSSTPKQPSISPATLH